MRKNVRRASIVLALAPLVSVPAATAFAVGTGSTGTTTISTPAPDGDASAVAATVDGVLTVGGSKAHAGKDGASSSADAIDVLGQRVVGGDQKGVGGTDGNLLGTGDTPVGDAEVAPWSTKVGNDGGGYQAMAEAALAHVNLADVLEAWALHSSSSATWNDESSTGDAASDGAEVSALGLLDVKVLHSEAHSSGKSRSALLVVNGTGVVTSDDTSGSCAVDAAPLLTLLCLNAAGGPGADGLTAAGASVATFDVAGGGLTGTISGSTSQGGASASPAAPGQTRTGERQSASGLPEAPRQPVSRHSLPFTGVALDRLVALAAALAALGGAVTAFARRPRGARG